MKKCQNRHFYLGKNVLVVEDGSAKAIPVEIKSTENVRSRSLGVYKDKYQPNRVVRISARNFGGGEVESVPLYATGCLADELALLRKGE